MMSRYLCINSEYMPVAASTIFDKKQLIGYLTKGGLGTIVR